MISFQLLVKIFSHRHTESHILLLKNVEPDDYKNKSQRFPIFKIEDYYLSSKYNITPEDYHRNNEIQLTELELPKWI